MQYGIDINRLNQVENPFSKASATMQGAGGTAGNMMRAEKTTTTPPGKTIGGGIMSAAGMGMSGAMIGAQIGSVGGPMGAAIGAGVGTLAYFLS
ncbi:MAG: hypothetical protein C0602_00185 [Denitrovibrio sp.]|nr:MAG: hypothetical protein C0602_00185 [Denitrovibrio sp.]